LRGQWHWDNQGYRKRRGEACSGDGLVCPRSTIQFNIHKGADEKGCRIKVHQGIVTVSQGDRIILKEERCGGLYNLKDENSVQGGVLRIKLEGSSSQGGASSKTATGREPC